MTPLRFTLVASSPIAILGLVACGGDFVLTDARPSGAGSDPSTATSLEAASNVAASGVGGASGTTASGVGGASGSTASGGMSGSASSTGTTTSSSAASTGSGSVTPCLACAKANCPNAVACLEMPNCIKGVSCLWLECKDKFGAGKEFKSFELCAVQQTLACFMNDPTAIMAAANAGSCLWTTCKADCASLLPF
ncbi:MAG: hypothetical protein FJ095_19095 [Deltaproteobacteria bacterium]|nr:hypothetical protein [Deltaproteobacteria bacterium]